MLGDKLHWCIGLCCPRALLKYIRCNIWWWWSAHNDSSLFVVMWWQMRPLPPVEAPVYMLCKHLILKSSKRTNQMYITTGYLEIAESYWMYCISSNLSMFIAASKASWWIVYKQYGITEQICITRGSSGGVIYGESSRKSPGGLLINKRILVRQQFIGKVTLTVTFRKKYYTENY